MLVCMYLYLYVCIFICMLVYMYTSMFVRMCVYVCMYIVVLPCTCRSTLAEARGQLAGIASFLPAHVLETRLRSSTGLPASAFT